VAQIRSIEARGLLDDIAQGAIQSSVKLIDAIRAAKSAVLTPAFKTGRVFVSTSGNGQSASFLIPSTLAADYTPTKVAAQMMEFVEIYSDCIATKDANGNTITPVFADADPVQTQLAGMLADDRLQSVRQQQGDFSSIRFPSYGGVRA
jgi:hypothetical protein